MDERVKVCCSDAVGLTGDEVVGCSDAIPGRRGFARAWADRIDRPRPPQHSTAWPNLATLSTLHTETATCTTEQRACGGRRYAPSVLLPTSRTESLSILSLNLVQVSFYWNSHLTGQSRLQLITIFFCPEIQNVIYIAINTCLARFLIIYSLRKIYFRHV